MLAGYANAMSESSDSDKKSTPASVGTVEKVTKSSEHKQTVKTATGKYYILYNSTYCVSKSFFRESVHSCYSCIQISIF